MMVIILYMGSYKRGDKPQKKNGKGGGGAGGKKQRNKIINTLR